jgi:hypothetical protein
MMGRQSSFQHKLFVVGFNLEKFIRKKSYSKKDCRENKCSFYL